MATEIARGVCTGCCANAYIAAWERAAPRRLAAVVVDDLLCHPDTVRRRAIGAQWERPSTSSGEACASNDARVGRLLLGPPARPSWQAPCSHCTLSHRFGHAGGAPHLSASVPADVMAAFEACVESSTMLRYGTLCPGRSEAEGGPTLLGEHGILSASPQSDVPSTVGPLH